MNKKLRIFLQSDQNKIIVFTFFVFLINIIQAIFTELHYDEAYYWRYSQKMAWGFFDHPPMVALMIKLGYSLINNELGVRLFPILISTATTFIALNWFKSKQVNLTIAMLLLLTFPLFHTHIGGFMALPDVTLVFFGLLFFIVYEKFIEAPDYTKSIIMGALLACMIYSKYHAFMVIGLTLLSNLKLLRSKYFWVTVVSTMILLIPHVIWQYENNFPTLIYHVAERRKVLLLKYVYNNLINQLLVVGPLTGVFVYWSVIKFKCKTLFDRAMLFNIWGFLIFFFILSFQSRIEAHWTVVLAPLLVLIAASYLQENDKIVKVFKPLAIFTIVLLLVFRTYMMIDAIPNKGNAKRAFWMNKEMSFQFDTIANGRTPAFTDYGIASLYEFYCKKPTALLSIPTYRFCQYDLWCEEDSIRGNNVVVFAANPKKLTLNSATLLNGDVVKFQEIKNFVPLTHLSLVLNKYEKQINNLAVSVSLLNNSTIALSLNDSSNISIGARQYNVEHCVTSISQLTVDSIIQPGNKAIINFPISNDSINVDEPFVLYIKNHETVRGPILKFEIEK